MTRHAWGLCQHAQRHGQSWQRQDSSAISRKDLTKSRKSHENNVVDGDKLGHGCNALDWRKQGHTLVMHNN